MDVFLAEIFSFPVVIFTLPLIVLMLFWLLAFAGLVDMEIFDIDVEVDADSDASADGTSATWLESLGLDGVPLTIALTIVDIYAFAFIYLMRKYLSPLFDGILSATATGGLLAILAIVLALPISAICIKPLRRFFYTHEGVGKNHMIGYICTLTTQTVTESFGQAVTDDGQTLNVRAPIPNEMEKGTRIALIDFDAITNCYSVVTEQELMSMSSSDLPLNS